MAPKHEFEHDVKLDVERRVRQGVKAALEEGLDLDRIDVGIMIETPGAALTIEDFIDEGIDFVSFGTNDLTQMTLGLSRDDAGRFLAHRRRPATGKKNENHEQHQA